MQVRIKDHFQYTCERRQVVQCVQVVRAGWSQLYNTKGSLLGDFVNGSA